MRSLPKADVYWYCKPDEYARSCSVRLPISSTVTGVPV